MALFMLVAPGLYDRFLVAEGKPESVVRGSPPSHDHRILSYAYTLTALDDRGMFRFQGWAFRNDEAKNPAGDYERRIVLAGQQGIYIFAAESTRSFDVDVNYKALGMDLTRAGFEALIYKGGLPPGLYSAGIQLTHKPDGETSYAFLKACILSTPNNLILQDMTDPECDPPGIDIGAPTGVNVLLPDETALWKMWLEKWETIRAGKYYQVEGWAFLTVDPTMSVEEYDRQLVLVGPQGNFVFAAEPVIRKDVEDYFESYGMDLRMSGFRALIDGSDLPNGVYGIGLLFTGRRHPAAYYVNTRRCLSRTEDAWILETNTSPACNQPYLAGSTSLSLKGEGGGAAR